jgi:hypothetical protein
MDDTPDSPSAVEMADFAALIDSRPICATHWIRFYVIGKPFLLSHFSKSA